MEGELRGLEIGERLVLLACQGGRVTAMDDSCNHAGCLLSGGWIDARKRAVVCPCHEYCFELGTGRNVTVPRLCGDQQAFAVRVVDGSPPERKFNTKFALGPGANRGYNHNYMYDPTVGWKGGVTHSSSGSGGWTS